MPGVALALAASPAVQALAASGPVTVDLEATQYVGMFNNDSRFGQALYVSPTDAHGLVRSAVLSALAGHTVQAASLWIYHSANWRGTGDAQLYRVLDGNDWDVSIAKWTLRKAGTAWLGGSSGCGTSGTDHDAAVAASGTVPTYTEGWFECVFNADGLADLQYQIDNAIPYGFVVKASTGSGWRAGVAPFYRVTYQ